MCSSLEKKKLFSKREKVIYNAKVDRIWDIYKKFSKKNFINAQIVRTIKIVDYDVSITDLANKLPVSEFLDYLKDNGINNIEFIKR